MAYVSQELKSKLAPKIKAICKKLGPRFIIATSHRGRYWEGRVMKMDHPYLLSWLKIARIALRDADLFDMAAEELALSDEEMANYRDTLDQFMGYAE